MAMRSFLRDVPYFDVAAHDRRHAWVDKGQDTRIREPAPRHALPSLRLSDEADPTPSTAVRVHVPAPWQLPRLTGNYPA
jgi:hypothetical protein